jgi:hypothetical protein
MEFNTIIKDKLSTLLESVGFKIKADSKDLVTFKSDAITIKFSYNKYEYDCLYFINLNNNDTAYEDFIVEGYLKIIEEPLSSIELWATRKCIYFETFKDTLLKGDEKFYSGLNEYLKKVTKEYNRKSTRGKQH